MASLLELGVSTGKWDAGLKKAQSALNNFVSAQGGLQKALEQDSEGVSKFIRMMGEMDSTAKTSRQQLKEYQRSYEELAAAYNRLTEAQKNGDVGKAMQSSMDSLRAKIHDTKREVDGINSSLRDNAAESGKTSNVLQDLAGKFGLNISQLTKFGAVMGVATTAVKVAQDAFFASESAVDEWGRTMEAGRAVYDSFLQTLNSGNFGGFISNMGNVIAKAREAYDAIDRLNTVMTIINPERVKLQTRQTQLQATIRRAGASSAEGKAAQEELRALEPKLQKSYRREAGMNWHAFEALVDERLEEANIHLDKRSKDFLMRSFHDTDTFNRLSAGARGEASRRVSVETPFGRGVRSTRDTRNTNQKLLDLFTDEWRQKNSPYLSAAFGALGQSYGVLRADARYLASGSGGSRGGGSTGGSRGGRVNTTPTYVPVEGSIDRQQQLVQELNKQWRAAADDDSRKKIKEQIEEATKQLDTMMGKAGEAPVGSMKYYSDWLKDLQEKQQNVTTRNDWEYYAGQIDFVTKKMKELRGETEKLPEMATGLSGITTNSLAAWSQSQQTSLGGKEIGSKEYNSIAANIIDTKTLENVLNASLASGVTLDETIIESIWDQIIGSEDIADQVWEELIAQINEKRKAEGLGEYTLNGKTGEVGQPDKKGPAYKDTADLLNNISSGISSITGGLQQLGIEIPEGLSKTIGAIQVVAGILTGISSLMAIITAIQGAKSVPIIGVFLANGGKVPHAANGYEVPGRNYSGDMTPIMANAGEIVLNKAAQNNLATQLQGGGIGNLHLETYVSGEDLGIVMTSSSRRRGRGEYVTTKTR